MSFRRNAAGVKVSSALNIHSNKRRELRKKRYEAKILHDVKGTCVQTRTGNSNCHFIHSFDLLTTQSAAEAAAASVTQLMAEVKALKLSSQAESKLYTQT